MRHVVAPALLALFALPVFGQAARVDPVAMCRAQNAEVRKHHDAAGYPPSVRELGTLFNANETCACIGEKLNLPGAKPLREDEASIKAYLRAHSECLTSHVAREFPLMCPRTYQDLLPLMGYEKPTTEQVARVCRCATKVMASRLDADTIFESMMDTYKYAQDHMAKNPDKPLDPTQGPPSSPMESGVREIQQCAVSELGAPKP